MIESGLVPPPHPTIEPAEVVARHLVPIWTAGSPLQNRRPVSPRTGPTTKTTAVEFVAEKTTRVPHRTRRRRLKPRWNSAFAGLHHLCAPMLDGLRTLPAPAKGATACAHAGSARGQLPRRHTYFACSGSRSAPPVICGRCQRRPTRVCRRRTSGGRRRHARRATLRHMASCRPRAGGGSRRRGSRRRRGTRDRRQTASNRGRALETVA